MKHDNRNIMVVLSSPSGAGKTTITKKIQQKINSFKISVSHTTRKPRLNEVDGIDYNFIDHKSFETKIKNNFLMCKENKEDYIDFKIKLKDNKLLESINEYSIFGIDDLAETVKYYFYDNILFEEDDKLEVIKNRNLKILNKK